MTASHAFDEDDLSSAQRSGEVGERFVTLPRQYAIDYQALLHDAELEAGPCLVACLPTLLLTRWRESYLAGIRRPTNLVQLRDRSFEYVFDLYSELEAVGEVPYDQTVEDRVVAVFGTSAIPGEARTGSRTRGWLGETAEIVAEVRDKGHFIAHCIGGGLSGNVFSQDRQLNRGWSAQGKIYRQMERYCQQRPGTFCFSRPVYADNSSVPRWLEFGLLNEDQGLWVEAFDNVFLR